MLLTNERDFPVPNQRQLSAKIGSAISHQLARKGKSMTIVAVGIDLAKNVFSVHGTAPARLTSCARTSPVPSSAKWWLLLQLVDTPESAFGLLHRPQ